MMSRRVLILLAIVLMLAPPLFALACLGCMSGPCEMPSALAMDSVPAEDSEAAAQPPCHVAMLAQEPAKKKAPATHCGGDADSTTPKMVSDCCSGAATLPVDSVSVQPDSSTIACDSLGNSTAVGDQPDVGDSLDGPFRPPPLASSALYTLHSTLLI